MERKSIRYLAACIFLFILYLVGRIGLSDPHWQPLFQKLVPVNLIITSILIFLFHKSWDQRFVISCIAVFAFGFLAEFAGVETGIIFGEYNYGKSLGIKLFDIPVIIGLNWLILVYCVFNILILLKIKNHFLGAVIGAMFLVFLDFFLETFAVNFDLWQWKSVAVPIQNYIGWFVLSSLLLLYFRVYNRRDHQINPVAVFSYFLQLLFFISFKIQ